MQIKVIIKNHLKTIINTTVKVVRDKTLSVYNTDRYIKYNNAYGYPVYALYTGVDLDEVEGGAVPDAITPPEGDGDYIGDVMFALDILGGYITDYPLDFKYGGIHPVAWAQNVLSKYNVTVIGGIRRKK